MYVDKMANDHRDNAIEICGYVIELFLIMATAYKWDDAHKGSLAANPNSSLCSGGRDFHLIIWMVLPYTQCHITINMMSTSFSFVATE